MGKTLIPSSDEIRQTLDQSGQHKALTAFDTAMAAGDKIQAIQIARKAGAIPRNSGTDTRGDRTNV